MKEHEVSDCGQNGHVEEERDGQDPDRPQVAFRLVAHHLI